MLAKISSMLDDVADTLEKKGLIKEAYEIDKIADMMDAIEAGDIPAGIGGTELGKRLSAFVNSVGKRITQTADELKSKFYAIIDEMTGHGLSAEEASKYKETMAAKNTPFDVVDYAKNIMLAAHGLSSKKYIKEE